MNKRYLEKLEKLVEKLDEGSNATNEQIMNMLNLTLKKADSLGLSESAEYEKLKNLYDAVKGDKDLNSTHHWDLGNMFSNKPTCYNYSEAIDVALEDLVKKMNEKIGNTEFKTQNPEEGVNWWGVLGTVALTAATFVFGGPLLVKAGKWVLTKIPAIKTFVNGAGKAIKHVGTKIVDGVKTVGKAIGSAANKVWKAIKFW